MVTFQSTLPRGERRKRSPRRQGYHHFNPRSREGSDYIPGNTHALHALFQSTLPRGERPHCCISSTFSINFNPRSREGSDGRNHGNAELVTGFQSTLPRGERHGLFSICNIITVFQSTLPRGERRFAICSPSLILGISIHAPARGATAPRTLRF